MDMRHGTIAMGAVETMMLVSGYAQIGRHLGLPTHGYLALSDSKSIDAQAGLESGMGALVAALSGVNSISGPGMLDFESCQSLEKLVLDNEICAQALRLTRGVVPREDFPALPLFEELLREKHLLIAKHTRRHLRAEHTIPGPVIDRANRSRWMAEGGTTLGERAHREVERRIAACPASGLSASVKSELTSLMTVEARRFGMERLPSGDVR